MTIVLGLLAFGVICFVIAFVVQLISHKKKPKPIIIFDQYSSNGKIWMLHMWKLYKSGETWKDSNKMYENFEEMFNLSLPTNSFGTKVEAYRKELGIVDNWTSIENEKDIEYQKGNFEFWISSNLVQRWHNQYKPLKGKFEAEAMKEDNLNIHSREILYYSCSKIDWYDPMSNAGIKREGYRFGPGAPMSFATGRFPPLENNFIGYVALSRGSIHITNKRIVFISGSILQNRTIDLDDVVGLSIYNEGIVLAKARGKNPLIAVPGYTSSLVPRDDFNQMIRVLYRIMTGTEAVDLTVTINT